MHVNGVSVLHPLSTPTTASTAQDSQQTPNNLTNGSTHPGPVKNTPKTNDAALVNAKNNSQTHVQSASCTTTSQKHAGLASSTSAQLRALAEYEAVCSSAVMQTVSFFAPTPTTSAQANAYAYDIAVQLKEFRRFGIAPLIFLEPTSQGTILNFNTYRSGAYDGALQAYFTAIKQAGIRDSDMGTWVSFPEGNIPVWGNVDATTYAANVTKTMTIMKSVFPRAKAGLLLDSTTYPNGISWSGGQFKSLSPYIQSIPKGLIDSFGLQGFPWSPPANQGSPSFNPYVYLQTSIAAEAARMLNTKHIWFNTGTFGTAYASSDSKRVTVSPAQRQTMLNGVISQAKTLQNQGFTVSVHMFNENKATTAEGIDWSYWEAGKYATSTHTPVFTTFAHNAQAAKIALWLFDVKE